MKRKPVPRGGPQQLSLFGEMSRAAEPDPKATPRRASAAAPKAIKGAEEFQASLEKLVRAPLRLILTDNRSSIITVKRMKDGGFQVRLHRIFAEADTATLRILAGFIRRPNRQNRKGIGDFIRRHLARIEAKPASPRQTAPIRTRGKVYDLAQILDQVARDYRLDAEGVRITWGQATRKRKFRAIRFGSYHQDRKLIRIHPLLDRKEVPRFFVDYIVYHELLHAVVPDLHRADGRRSCHHREFKQREKHFARYREAIAFEKRLVQGR